VLTALVVEKLISNEEIKRNSKAHTLACRKLAGPLYGIKMQLADVFKLSVKVDILGTTSLDDQALKHDKALLSALWDLDYKNVRSINANKLSALVKQLTLTRERIEETLVFYMYAFQPEELLSLHKLLESIKICHGLLSDKAVRKDVDFSIAILTVYTPLLLVSIEAAETTLNLDKYPK
jgi:hypothetical protein